MEKTKNPFKRYSSRSQRLSYFLPDYKEWQDTSKHGFKDSFIGREDILYQLRNWVLSKAKTGSFLVAGYRGMGKTSFVNKALYNVTRQRRRSSWIEFLFTLLHIMLIIITFLFLYNCQYIRDSSPTWWGVAIGICGSICVVCIGYITYYLNKYQIGYHYVYTVFKCRIMGHCISKKWKECWKGKGNGIKKINECIKECKQRHTTLDEQERSRLNKTIFHDFRDKKFNRISISINLGHEVLTERDVLCLIAKNIKHEVNQFISNKHSYSIPAFIYILLCCSLASLIFLFFIRFILPAADQFYGNYFSNSSIVASKSLIQKTIGYWIQVFSNVRFSLQGSAYAPLLPFLFFTSIYYLVYRFSFLPLRFIPGIGKYMEIKKRLTKLNERIEATINEETNTIQEASKNIINVSLGGDKKNKNYPLAGAREIESELIFILKLFDRICKCYTLNFIIIFDELDKIDPEAESKGKEEVGFLSTENSPNGFSAIGNSRERKENVLRLLANMKHFITVARAKFIFISGRELYDAYLAGLSDREFAISSVFNEAIYVESFLTSNRSQMDVVSMTEQYICKMLLPRNYMKNIMIEKYIKYGITQKDIPSLKWYYIYLRDQLKKERKTKKKKGEEEKTS